MNIRAIPSTIDALMQMGGEATRFEAAGDRPASERGLPLSLLPGEAERNVPLAIKGVLSCITEVSTPTGKMPVLKAMVTTACERDCYYCPFRAGRGKMRRQTFKPGYYSALAGQGIKG